MTRRTLLTAVLWAFASGCEPPPAPAPAAAEPPAASQAPAAPSAPSTPSEVLDQMDKRAPVPLLPMMANHQKANMRDHLLAVQEIVVALASGDFAAVEKAAGRIGYSAEMGRMCSHMGMGAPGFTDKALGFHRAADKIVAAARARDEKRVLQELGTTLETCTSCHSTWKQKLVDDAAWSRATSAPVPSAMGPH
ncbi:MAG: cytochrome c [Myxococcales bacterium]|nr:cytochrome c [Myxococcales bacterium]